MRKPTPGWLFPAAAIALLLVLAGPVAAVLLTLPPVEVIGVFAQPAVEIALRTSLAASAAATLAAAVLGIPAGYWLARAPERARTPILFALALPLAFPPVASGIMLLNAIGPQSPLGMLLAHLGITVTDSLAGVALAEFFVSGSLIAIASAAAFAANDPQVEDAVRTLGVSERAIFLRVALPGAAGGVAAGVALAWLRALGEFGATSIVAYHPPSLPVTLYVTLSSQGVRPALAIAYAFVACSATVAAAAWVLRRRVVV